MNGISIKEVEFKKLSSIRGVKMFTFELDDKERKGYALVEVKDVYDDVFIMAKEIRKNYIYNQRVKEAIDKVKYPQYEESFKAPINYKINEEDLLKELGLDK